MTGGGCLRGVLAALFALLATLAPPPTDAASPGTTSILYLVTEGQARRVPEIRSAFAAAMRERGLAEADVAAIRFETVSQDPASVAAAAERVRADTARVLVVPTFMMLEALLFRPDRPPLVFFAASTDLVASLPVLARPAEARATGVNAWGTGHVESKMLELALLARPGAAAVCVLGARETASTGMHGWLEGHASSRQVAVTLYPVDRIADLDRYVARHAFDRCDAFIVYAHPAFDENPRQYVATLNRLRRPAVYATPGATRAGGLVGIEPDLRRLREHAWDQIAAIHRGAPLAGLPVYQADSYRVTVNVPALRMLARPPDKGLLLRAAEFHYD